MASKALLELDPVYCSNLIFFLHSCGSIISLLVPVADSLACLPPLPNLCAGALTLNVTVLGERAFKKVIEVK